jgi:hypothetical protein
MAVGGVFTLIVNDKHKYSSTNHKNKFAYESQKHFVKTNINFGIKFENTIFRGADILHGISIDITLPEIKAHGGKFRWKNNIGERIISSLDLFLNYNETYSQYGEFYNIWNQLTLSKDKLRSYNVLIGQQNPIVIVDDNGNISKKMDGLQTFKNYHSETTLSIPIRFIFKNTNDEYNNHLSGLPIECMINNPKITIMLERFENLYEVNSIHTVINDGLEIRIPYYSMSLDWIFLDNNDNRNTMIHNSHRYIINNIKKREINLYNNNIKINLNFNGCVKELIWTIEEKHDYNYWTQMSNLFDGLAQLTNPYIANSIMDHYYENESFNDKKHIINWAFFFNKKRSESNKNQYFLKSAKIISHNIELQTERSGEYYNLTQSYQHHSYIPKDKNIYLYSFADCPENIEASGFLDFNRLEDIDLDLKLNEINSSNPGILKIYAITQDTLDIHQGNACFNIKQPS